MNSNISYFETTLYIGIRRDYDIRRHKLRKISLRATEPRLSKKYEASFGKCCCDVVFALEGQDDHHRVISAPDIYTLFNLVFGHFREWVRNVMESNPKEVIYLKNEDGVFSYADFEVAFLVNDCITWTIRDKIEFADKHGYTEDWDTIEAIEPKLSKKYKLEVQSDFGQIQIYDNSIDVAEPPEWTEISNLDFACHVKGALFVRVMENDDHSIPFQLLESEPDEDHGEFCHVVDVPFTTSGGFEVENQPVKVRAGTYILRWYCSKTKTSHWKYQIKMWPSQARKVTVVKRCSADD